jgi:pre-mRNA-processing factor 6
MLGQAEERAGRAEAARAAYAAGLKRCADAVPLWRAAAALEERAGALAKARALLEQARLRNPKTPELWLAAIRTEQRAPGGAGARAAEALLAKALQDCPTSGPLWAEAIAMAPRPARKTKSADALKRCDSDAHIVAAVATLFWGDRKNDKARAWFGRAVALDPDNGDFWALYYRFEQQHGGGPEAAADVARRCAAADPRHGERWTAVSKDPKNAHQPCEAILRKVAAELEAP